MSNSGCCFFVLLALANAADCHNCTSGFVATSTLFPQTSQWASETCDASISRPICARAIGETTFVSKVNLEAGFCEEYDECFKLTCAKLGDKAKAFIPSSNQQLQGTVQSLTLESCDIKCCIGENCNNVSFADVIKAQKTTTTTTTLKPTATAGTSSGRFNFAMFITTVILVASLNIG